MATVPLDTAKQLANIFNFKVHCILDQLPNGITTTIFTDFVNYPYELRIFKFIFFLIALELVALEVEV